MRLSVGAALVDGRVGSWALMGGATGPGGKVLGPMGAGAGDVVGLWQAKRGPGG